MSAFTNDGEYLSVLYELIERQAGSTGSTSSTAPTPTNQAAPASRSPTPPRSPPRRLLCRGLRRGPLSFAAAHASRPAVGLGVLVLPVVEVILGAEVALPHAVVLVASAVVLNGGLRHPAP